MRNPFLKPQLCILSWFYLVYIHTHTYMCVYILNKYVWLCMYVMYILMSIYYI